MSALSLEKRPDRIALITINTPRSPVNLLSGELLKEFTPILDRIELDSDIWGCVLISGKPDGFIAGADLKAIQTVTQANQAETLSRQAQRVLDRIEGSRKPFVAAIHGAALGGGLEVALACHARLATDDPKTTLALPEVMLGLLPGAGGTQRLVKTVGLTQALPMILTGQTVRAKKALRIGLVDQLVSKEALIPSAVATALRFSQQGRPSRGARLPLKEKLLLQSMRLPWVSDLFLHQARKGVLAKTGGHYPAPLSILRCVQEGLRSGHAVGSEIEAHEFGNLVVSHEAKNLVWLFNATQELKKAPKEPEPRPVRRLLVLGAGLMGEGIAAVSLPLNPVSVRDPFDGSLERMKKNLGTSLDKRVQSGSLAADKAQDQLSRLQTAKELADLPKDALRETDLVIEAVFEDLELKRQVLADCEARLPEDAVFASNTSALPISKIAEKSARPGQVLGMHYFSPVPKMPLLEIVVTPKTSPTALATAHAYGVQQGKSVIVVKDSPGFYTTRVLAPLLNEAMLLLEEGVSIASIDRAGKEYGFPVGPITLLDEVGIDVGAHVSQDLAPMFARRGGKASALLPKLKAAGFAGRKNKKGFYRYDAKRAKGPKQINPEIQALLPPPPSALPLPEHDIRDRLAMIFINEALYCLQEGVIRGARDGDVGAILGLGFPPFRGGPFHAIDSQGARSFERRMKELAQKYGDRFQPAPLLSEMAASGTRFY